MNNAQRLFLATIKSQFDDSLHAHVTERMAHQEYARSVRRRDEMIAYVLGEAPPNPPRFISWKEAAPFTTNHGDTTA